MTELGKVIRSIRITRGELLIDMANKMGYSVSFLSSIEVGKNLPHDFKDKLLNIYTLSQEENEKINAALQLKLNNEEYTDLTKSNVFMNDGMYMFEDVN